MVKYERFAELPVWQQAARLYNAVPDLLEDCNGAAFARLSQSIGPGFAFDIYQHRRRF
jgi:hypothetical protein